MSVHCVPLWGSLAGRVMPPVSSPPRASACRRVGCAALVCSSWLRNRNEDVWTWLQPNKRSICWCRRSLSTWPQQHLTNCCFVQLLLCMMRPCFRILSCATSQTPFLSATACLTFRCVQVCTKFNGLGSRRVNILVLPDSVPIENASLTAVAAPHPPAAPLHLPIRRRLGLVSRPLQASEYATKTPR